MPSHSSSDATSESASAISISITNYLPPNPWLLELCYQCIRMHEEGLRTLQAANPGYDPLKTLEIIAEVRAMRDRLMAKGDLTGLKREMAFAFWERGLQPDAAKAVQNGLADKIRDDENGQEIMLAMLKLFLPDPGYQSEHGLALYGGAALCVHLSELAGMERDQMLKDAFEQLRERADRTE